MLDAHWIHIGYLEYTLDILDTHRIPWIHIGYLGYTMDALDTHWIPWIYIGYLAYTLDNNYGLPYSFVCLENYACFMEVIRQLEQRR